jgi:hypothetical protein
MTLKELIEKHGLPVKVRHDGWTRGFITLLVKSEQSVIADTVDGEKIWPLKSPDWHLYTEPAHKKVYYQAVAQTVSGAKVVAPNLFTDAESAEDFLGTEFVKLLTDRPIEV